MGIWDWKGVKNDKIALRDAPSAAHVAASIIPNDALDEEFENSVAEKTGLPLLSLVEWSISDEIVTIFPFLWEFGSRHGYVVEREDGFKSADYCRKINLGRMTTENIHCNSAMDMPMAFVDDQQICALVSYHSDYALIGMREDVFQLWVAKTKLDLRIFDNEQINPAPLNLQMAQEQAARRTKRWVEFWAKP